VTLAETQRLFWNALRGEPVDRSFVTGADRLDVYAEMFVFRQVDALREDFPETAARLGEEKFFELGKRYLLAHPSEDPDLGRIGRRFAEFSGEPGAALEWARSEVFLEAEVPRMEREEFARRLSVRIVPALRLVEETAVWRTPGGFEINEVRLPAEEARALRLAMEGASFEEVCAAFGEPAPAFEALQSWLAEGWIAR
jgi:hypothetical protein